MMRGMAGEAHLAGSRKMTVKPTGSWPCFIEKCICAKNVHFLKTVDETEDHMWENPVAGLVLSLKTEVLIIVEAAKVQSAVRAKKWDVLRKAVEKTLCDIFLNGHEAAEKGVQDSFCQCIKYVPKHLVTSGTLDLIFELSFDKWSRSDFIMQAIAACITKNR